MDSSDMQVDPSTPPHANRHINIINNNNNNNNNNSNIPTDEHTTYKKKKTGRIVVDNTNMDLDIYLQNNAYLSIYNKVDRLLFIADHAPPHLIRDSYAAAITLLQSETLDSQRYLQIVQKANEAVFGSGGGSSSSGSNKMDMTPFIVDQAWVESADGEARRGLEKLEGELKTYKANMVKESIRMGYNDLAAHYYRCGDLANTIKAYGRTRDYCSTSKHVLEMCFNIIRVSIETGNFMNAQSHVFKLESTPDLPNPAQTNSKLKSITGLAHLESGKFKKAAKAFLDVTFDPTTTGPFSTIFHEALSPSDIAIYGGLCALSSFDRSELQTHVLENPQFRQFLELEPWVRELINGFYQSRYTTCFEILDRTKNDLLLDPYLMPHIPILYGNIRKKALIQYFKPFTSVSMDKMATTFNTSFSALEHELKALIMEDAIQARIDAQHRVLYLKTFASRQRVVRNVEKLGEAFERDVRHGLVRLELALNGLVVSRGPGAGSSHEGVVVVDQQAILS